ncbi:MAG: MBL fold metallo-hydrolase [Xanthomonadaceae bacterium]|nr:MBL fold metallo-hydrolase [Xanthomonadaceae bacterium]
MNLIIQPIVFAKDSLSAKWLGVAGVAITDGKDTLIFDPVPTKPSLSHWLFGTELKSDVVRVSTMLRKAEIERVSGVFMSHTHFDHAVDGAEVALMMRAPIYGGVSVKRITEAYSPAPKYIELTPEKPVQIGKFKITPIRRGHAPIASLFHFLPGEIAPGFDFKFYQYREGETWNYFIEHLLGNILFDQGGRFHPANKKYSGRVDTYFAGIANRRSVEDWVDNSILVVKAKRVVPIHFDVFFLKSEWLEKQWLPGAGLDKLERMLKEKSPTTKWVTPVLYQKINLNE